MEELGEHNIFNNILGIEPSPALANDCRKKGFKILEKTIENIDYDEISIDYATSFEVFEHLYLFNIKV